MGFSFPLEKDNNIIYAIWWRQNAWREAAVHSFNEEEIMKTNQPGCLRLYTFAALVTFIFISNFLRG